MGHRCVAIALTLGIVVAGTSPSLAQTTQQPDVGWHVPWAIGGPRLAPDGSVFAHPGEWPSFAVRSLRLWDTRTAWLNLQPRPDRFDFAHLDAHLARAQQAGVEHITLVLAGTPRWAASRESSLDASWLGPGSASPPADIRDWELFVETVASRYRGRIQAYEIGNEPNLAMFWSGNLDELRLFVVTAAEAIRRVDPGATIVAPAPLITELRDASYARALWSSIAHAPIDVLAFHFYPRSPRRVADLTAVVRQLRTTAKTTGFYDLPVWITEANPGEGTTLRDMQRLLEGVERERIDRLYWYAWSGQTNSALVGLP